MYIFIRVLDFKQYNFFVKFIKSSISEKSLLSLAVMSICFWSTCWKAKPNDTANTIPAGAKKQATASLIAGCVRWDQRKSMIGWYAAIIKEQIVSDVTAGMPILYKYFGLFWYFCRCSRMRRSFLVKNPLGSSTQDGLVTRIKLRPEVNRGLVNLAWEGEGLTHLCLDRKCLHRPDVQTTSNARTESKFETNDATLHVWVVKIFFSKR